jgi:hypothetical protein
MKRSLLALAVIIGASAPAFADEYYVVRGPDKKCRVVESRPVDSTVVQVGPLAFVTRERAESEVRVLCKDEYGDVERERIEVERVR